MQLSSLASADRFYLPGTMDPGHADSLSVDTDHIAIYEMDFSAIYASISGNISGSWQEAQSSCPRIEIFSADSVRIGNSYCSSDGAFTCDLFIPQEVRLRSGYFGGVGQWIGGDSYETARVFDVRPGDRITDITIVESGIQVWLEGPGDLTVHRPTVLVLDEAGNEFVPRLHTENPFSVCNLRPGRYYLHVDGHCDNQIWAAQWYDGSETLGDATPIDLGEGELRHLVIELVEGGRIEGGVLMPDDQRPAYAFCGLFDVEGEALCPMWEQSRRWTEGLFNFSGLSDGVYFLAVRNTDYTPWWYPGTSSFTEAIPITIEDHATVTGISWSLPQAEKGVRL